MFWKLLIILLILYGLYVIFEYGYVECLHEMVNPLYYKDIQFKVKSVNQTASQIGFEIAKQSKIVFCGLCRDIENRIIKNIEMFEQTGQYFYDYRIVLFENDSQDQTREFIRQKAKTNQNIILIDCGQTNPNCIFKDKKMYDYGSLSEKRIERMAYFRNQYISYIKENLSHFDYVMMMDMDVQGYYNIDGLMESIAQPKWDAMFANGRMPVSGTFGLNDLMYDQLAFIDQKTDLETLKKKKEPTFMEMTSKIIRMQTYGQKWIPVQSAFNGCGIYKMKSILNCKFNSEYGCEWIGFHQQMGEKIISRDWKLYVGWQGPSFIKMIFSSLQ
jgi:hypothetical protein